ncbi:hypothetical protein GP486_003471 [Trichoglossum hirsutum]|uniref:TRUD domain-containing protein n=1 Tax=Trichoglossum hirsutum TaxID=265104 RepID=A0A9P8RQM9_9PEZI|nr:hypothetical protein GP486_003471 [Trichoglossum hirsutum]
MEDLIGKAQSPTKRQKLSPIPDIDQAMRTGGITNQNCDSAQPASRSLGPGNFTDLHRLREMEVGITDYVDDTTLGFSGTMKMRYTDFLVNEILPTGQVLHLEGTKVNVRPTQTKQTTTGGSATNPQGLRIPTQLAQMGRISTGTTPVNQPSSGKATSSPSSLDLLQKKREDALTAWARLPEQLAQEDFEHKKKQLEEYAAYKRQVGLSDPQLDTSTCENKGASPPKTDAQVTKSPSIRQGAPDYGSEEIATSNASKDPARPSDLREESGQRSGETTSRTTTDQAVVEPSIAVSEKDGKSSFQLSAEDESLLLTFFTPTVLKEILILYSAVLESKDKKGESFGRIKSNTPMERARRTQLHQSVRRIFCSRLETETDANGAIVVSAAKGSGRSAWGMVSHQTQRITGPQPKGKSIWEERGGEYLHFTLYKENKDTMEVMSFLARQLKMQPRSLQFAGNKDRRAVTVQRASAHRLDARRLAGMNKVLHGSRVGGFEYKNEGLSLGDLAGNEFVITLRDCKFPTTEGMSFREKLAAAEVAIRDSASKLKQNGFLNYYGLQRFGSFATGTHQVGMQILRGNFQRACEQILSFSDEALAAAKNHQTLPPGSPMIPSDDVRRAAALDLFKTAGRGKEALESIPRRFSAEAALIKHLSQEGRSKDWQGALQSISRPLRLMYVHAYQSFVWNVVAGERWRRWGKIPVEGDLVLVRGNGDMDADTDELEEDENGELVIHATQTYGGRGRLQEFERARPLSKEEAASGKFSIFDIVLPTPGFDVVYPVNSLADFYKSFMGSERGGGLDPHNMRRAWKDISLSGSYRKLIGVVKGLEFEVRSYVGEEEQMVVTDLGRLEKTNEGVAAGGANVVGRDSNPATADIDQVGGSEGGDQQRKIAVVVKFQLGPSQYATMALRELMKDGAVIYKPEYGGGR